MSEPLPCPFCGEDAAEYDSSADCFACDACDAAGPAAGDEEHLTEEELYQTALAFWNKRPLQVVR